ncbi:MAG: adenylate/guanylate cyclase domain-containing protein [Bacteroidales bacterium]|jgi:class 3 adenylate cyclase/HAMP domain-containing protein|nr:adenylate/guanylate cyclase domain-containing protein [Bacteroidales bacterium]
MKKAPKYISFRIFLSSALLYFFLVIPFAGFMWVQKMPELLMLDTGMRLSEIDSGLIVQTQKEITQKKVQEYDSPDILSTKLFDNFSPLPVSNDNTKGTNHISNSFDYLINSFLVCLVILGIFSAPFKRFFRKRRKQLSTAQKLEDHCRKWLLKTPVIHTILFAIPLLISLGYTAWTLYSGTSDNDIKFILLKDYFYVSFLAALLTILFVYYWSKHRVHLFYLEILFTDIELRKRIFKQSVGKIRDRLWISSGMTTLLPLSIVIFYIVLSVTSFKDLGILNVTPEIRTILYGSYADLSENITLGNTIYINSINALMMIAGIGTSIFVSLVYIFAFVRWTTLDIVYPVKELLYNIHKTGEGEGDANFSLVRTNDEIGELSEGFNIMAQRIKDHIDNINALSISYFRFVPKQFLDFLGKKKITDIKLGDQIQREMTVMFSDIREFTEISENFTPKENFDFINHYLGYMEPVVMRNNGFIDKYIGDSIMALYSLSVNDAINAAIEMRAKLQEFNEDLEMNGKAPIDSGIGIHTGDLMLGIVGGRSRIEGTVISDHVNLASRLEGLTKIYGAPIIVSQDSLIKIDKPLQYNFRFLDIVKVKGRKSSVNIFEILDGEKAHQRKLKIVTKEQFNKAIELYRNKHFKEASDHFSTLQHINPNDKAIHLYLDRCEKNIQHGIPEDWDGVEILHFK